MLLIVEGIQCIHANLQRYLCYSFVVRNNGFAISTPSSEQYAGDGIASRGPGYGISTIRVDGNDILAVRSAIQQAKVHCTTHSKPFLVECMTYRVGHHSTSDDSSAYRSKRDVEDWKRMDNPISRFEKFCIDRKWWSEEETEELKKEYRKQIVKALEIAEKKKRPKLSSLFEDTYKEIPGNLKVSSGKRD
jgi:2-oxoisovalerate dehydrogenase E1 component alpha subunit